MARLSAPLDARSLVGTHDILFMTIDTLRYDVAMLALENGETPNLARHLPAKTWEQRQTPGSFTYAAHHAFFAGFLPTPAAPGSHARLFAARFAGSESTAATTFVFDTPDIVSGLASHGYRTICIGGVGFFNRRRRYRAVGGFDFNRRVRFISRLVRLKFCDEKSRRRRRIRF